MSTPTAVDYLLLLHVRKHEEAKIKSVADKTRNSSKKYQLKCSTHGFLFFYCSVAMFSHDVRVEVCVCVCLFVLLINYLITFRSRMNCILLISVCVALQRCTCPAPPPQSRSKNLAALQHSLSFIVIYWILLFVLRFSNERHDWHEWHKVKAFTLHICNLFRKKKIVLQATHARTIQFLATRYQCWSFTAIDYYVLYYECVVSAVTNEWKSRYRYETASKNVYN